MSTTRVIQPVGMIETMEMSASMGMYATIGIAMNRVRSPIQRHAGRLRGLQRSAIVAMCVVIASVVASSARAQAVIWRGTSAGFAITWSDRDISVARAGRVVFSARRMADREWAEMQGDHDEDVPVREYEQRFRLLSVVGAIISLEEATYCDCGGAHPISWTRYVSYDLSRSTVARPHAIPATEVVAEADLLRALAADRLIRQAMDSAHVRTFPSLRALTQALEAQPIASGDDCIYSVGEEFPTAFAFHHLEGGRVAMRFSLGHYVEVCRGMMIQVGVLVPVPAQRAAAFAAADRRQAGVLTKDLAVIAGDRRTVVNYRSRR